MTPDGTALNGRKKRPQGLETKAVSCAAVSLDGGAGVAWMA